jgi:hypothetical protein
MQGMQILSWPRYPDLDLNYFVWILKQNAKELTFARRLATEVSFLTKRPVLTLHNASMGAPSGWGIPDFKTQIGRDFLIFNQKLEKENTQLSKTKIKRLVNLWQKRLIEPQLREYLWQLKETQKDTFKDMQREIKDIVLPCFWEKFSTQEGVCWEWSVDLLKKRILFLKHKSLQERQRLFLFFPLLIKILKTAALFLKKGRTSFVLPYIDKFIRSSYGDKDIDFAKVFFEFITQHVPEIIILFFDETVHPKGPTLKLAIAALNKEKEWIKGLGVYGKGEIIKAQDIAALSRHYQIFFVSAFQEKTKPFSFREIREQYPHSYHPAWRDGLEGFFYGTQVEFLSGSDIKELVITDKGPIPLGQFVRLKLKEYALVPKSKEPFWYFYASLANLN